MSETTKPDKVKKTIVIEDKIEDIEDKIEDIDTNKKKLIKFEIKHLNME